MDIISRPDDYREKYAPFLERMSAEGFVVEDDVQEMDIIREEFDSLWYFLLTIAICVVGIASRNTKI